MRILSRKQGSVSETRAQAPMGKFIQLSEGVFTRWKNCMAVLSLESDTEMAEFLLNRLLEDRLREMGQQNSREGTPSPIPSDSGVSAKGSSSPTHLTHRVNSPSPKTVSSYPTAATIQRTPDPRTDPRTDLRIDTGTDPGTDTKEKQEHRVASFQTSTHSSDFAEYKHKLERRKRKPAVEHNDSSIKVAKMASETQRNSEIFNQASSGKSSSDGPVLTGDVQVACVPSSNDQNDGRKPDSIIQRQDVIVTPRSQSQRPSEAFHGTCGEEAMDLSVRPTKDLYMEGLRQEHVGQRQLSATNDRDPSHPNFQSTLRGGRGGGYVGVYDSSDLSDGSRQCASPQPGFNNNKVSSNDSGSDFDSCSGSPIDSSQQSVQGREEMDGAKPGSNMGGIESIVQRLHQVKSETPSRSDSEDESDYYAVTFKDLIARTISRCDRYGKTQQRGKRKRASRTSSELSAARKEEIMATKKLLERVSKNKRDKFKLTINCSTDGSEHVRNAAASEAIATLVRNVWHKENPKPIGQVIKEMVAKRLSGQEGEGEENDPRDIGLKRKGPMTIKDILNSRSDNLVEEFDRSAKLGEDDEELLVVSDDPEKEGMEDEADLALSAAETLRKMAKINEKRDENCPDPTIPASGKPVGQQKHRESAVSENDSMTVKNKHAKERDGHDDDSYEEDQSNDHEQRKKAKRRSRKKKRRLAKVFSKEMKSNEDDAIAIVQEKQHVIGQKEETSDSRGSECLPVTKKDTLVHSPDQEITQWPAEAMKMKGSVAQNVVQMSGDLVMGTMRSLVEKIQDEDEEVDVVMETKEIPRPMREHAAASPEILLTESIPAPKKEPPKPAVISHSISQILEQKGSTSSADNRGRCTSRSNSVISAPHTQVQLESSEAYESSNSKDYQVAPIVPPGSSEASSVAAGLERNDDRVDRESSGEGGGQGEIKSMSTATEFLIRIALMQNDGSRQGEVETQ